MVYRVEIEKRAADTALARRVPDPSLRTEPALHTRAQVRRSAGQPILPIALTPWVWGGGLQLMFQELQVAAFDHGRGFTGFDDALRVAAPRIYG